MLQQDAGLALRVVHLQREHVLLRVAEDHRVCKVDLEWIPLCWSRCAVKSLLFQQVKLPMIALFDKNCGGRLRHSCCCLINSTVS